MPPKNTVKAPSLLPVVVSRQPPCQRLGCGLESARAAQHSVRMHKRLSLLLALVFLASAAQAQKIHRWVDEQGRVHYGDRPPAGAEEVPIRKRNAPALTENLVDPSCEEKRAKLIDYRDAARIVETDALGNEKEYSPEQRQMLIERTEASVLDACGELPA